MTDTPEEAALAKLEAPFQELQNARAELATLQSLVDTTPHEGAKAAIKKDMPALEARLTKAEAALTSVRDQGVTPAQIDQAAQAVIDARGDEPEAEEA